VAVAMVVAVAEAVAVAAVEAVAVAVVEAVAMAVVVAVAVAMAVAAGVGLGGSCGGCGKDCCMTVCTHWGTRRSTTSPTASSTMLITVDDTTTRSWAAQSGAPWAGWVAMERSVRGVVAMSRPGGGRGTAVAVGGDGARAEVTEAEVEGAEEGTTAPLHGAGPAGATSLPATNR
jgi:hypothetical protein